MVRLSSPLVLVLLATLALASVGRAEVNQTVAAVQSAAVVHQTVAEAESPDGYHPINFLPLNKTYKAHKRAKSWTDAQIKCQGEGAKLVEIKTELEAAAVILLFAEVPLSKGDFAHVGIKSQSGLERDWRTVSGTNLDTIYNVWMDGEPTNEHEEVCGSISRTGKYQPNHNFVYDVKPFLCEKGPWLPVH